MGEWQSEGRFDVQKPLRTTAREVHTFDPDGDLILQLIRTPEKERDPVADEQRKDGEDANLNVVEGQEQAAGDAPHANDGTEEHKPAEDSKTETLSDDPERPSLEEIGANVDMIVSSRHLMLASPVFKAMLRLDGFKEGHKLESAGKAEIPLPDDDPEALIILLDIIHGRNRRIPRQISLDLMTKVTILVDKYQMVEAAEVFSESWIEHLKMSIPTEYVTPEDQTAVHKWIGISWVFGNRKEFQDMTMFVQRGCGSDLEEKIEEGLLIPDIIIDTITQKRKDALFELYALVEQTIRRYQRQDIFCLRTRDVECRPSCDALLLGSLTRSASALGIYPVPDSPYGTTCFDKLAIDMMNLNAEALCDSIMPWSNSDPHKYGHGFHDAVKLKLDDLEKRLSGLDMGEYKKSKVGP
ncbi:hypothetical protein EG329_007759 [Mollisiaceae sp. DMI_Dod_QoI]|nr:hypothetical protein EG329_007759 [Helotiales sp. DMI_Dod_QoI]